VSRGLEFETVNQLGRTVTQSYQKGTREKDGKKKEKKRKCLGGGSLSGRAVVGKKNTGRRGKIDI